MKHNTSHDAVLTKFRPTMARMTGSDTPPTSNLSPFLRLICPPPAPIDWINPFMMAKNSMAKNSDIILQCYVNLTDSLEKYRDNWMCDENKMRHNTQQSNRGNGGEGRRDDIDHQV